MTEAPAWNVEATLLARFVSNEEVRDRSHHGHGAPSPQNRRVDTL
jgi:hypothetical protein